MDLCATVKVIGMKDTTSNWSTDQITASTVIQLHSTSIHRLILLGCALTFTVKSFSALVVELPVCATATRSTPEYTVHMTS